MDGLGVVAIRPTTGGTLPVHQKPDRTCDLLVDAVTGGCKRLQRKGGVENRAALPGIITKAAVGVLVRYQCIDQRRDIAASGRVDENLAGEEFGVGFGVAVEKAKRGCVCGLTLLTEGLVRAEDFGGGLGGGGSVVAVLPKLPLAFCWVESRASVMPARW